MSELRSRWYHKPALHTPQIGVERTANWLELFYDLIYVAAIIQLGNALSHHVSLLGFIGFVGVFIPIWLAWTSFTFFTNRFIIDDFLHRALVFLQMFGVGAMAVCVPDVLDGDPTAFAKAYAFVRGVFVLFYLRTWLQVPAARELSKRWAILSGLDALMWLISVLLPWPWMFLLWAVGIGFQLSVSFHRSTREVSLKYPVDMLHMSERYGLLTIIVLGESFVKVLSSLYENGLTTASGAMGCLALMITCSLWWIYFDDVAGSRLKEKRAAPFVWVYTHLPMTIAITAIGVSIKKTLFFDPFVSAPAKYAWMLCGTLGLALLAVSLIDSVTERRQSNLSDRSRVLVRLASAGVVVLLATVSQAMPSWLFLTLVTGMCMAQVVFDLMMAPLEADEEMAMHDAARAIEAATRATETATGGGPAPGKRRADALSPVVKGVPSELKNDLFYFFMEGSWTRFVGSLLFLYLVVNFIFGALYLLEPGAIASVSPGNIAEAFFFSVQTMSTIGYGTMVPDSTYGHVLVTIEAALGLISVALVTGLMFTKAARPKANIMFSNNPIVTTHHGVSTLMFRVGNTRGNEIVSAEIAVTALVDEVSPEGHQLRRIHELNLRRNRTQIFAMSWTITHEINDQSPLAGIDWDNPTDNLRAIIVTMTGHDSTYAQTIYARHLYYPDEIRYGYNLVDVISDLDDGRLMVDYSKFHDIEVDPACDLDAPEPAESAESTDSHS